MPNRHLMPTASDLINKTSNYRIYIVHVHDALYMYTSVRTYIILEMFKCCVTKRCIFQCFCLLKYIRFTLNFNHSMTKLWRIYPFYRRRGNKALKKITLFEHFGTCT